MRTRLSHFYQCDGCKQLLAMPTSLLNKTKLNTITLTSLTTLPIEHLLKAVKKRWHLVI